MNSDFRNLPFDDKPPFLFRYRPFYQNLSSDDPFNFTIDELKGGYIYFQSRTKLNDPYDCYPGLLKMPSLLDVEKYRKMLKKVSTRQHIDMPRGLRKQIMKNTLKNLDEAKSNLEQVIVEQFDNHGIACFSSGCANHLLWSHYASFHTGLCLVFNSACERILSEPFMVNYVPKLEPKEFNLEADDFKYLMTTKHSVWSEEKEIRVFSKNKGKKFFDRSSLVAIIFGMKSSYEFKTDVIKATKNDYNNLEYYNCDYLENEFGVQLTKLNV